MNEEIFRTIVPLPKAPFCIVPAERVLCIGSCFADEMARRFQDDHFPTIANPFGVMYNPASILHTIERLKSHLVKPHLEEAGVQQNVLLSDLVKVRVALLTLGTNHVYVEKATGEIVDNCQKRPQQLFDERCLDVDECADYLRRSIDLLHDWNPEMKIVLTVSPIRYRKYGYHESQLSKATLLMAVDQVTKSNGNALFYFPSYEILLDELRDYRFYATDMLHPSEQAVGYIYRRFQECCFSDEARLYVEEWRPIREALAHRPFNPDSPEYQAFKEKTRQQLDEFNRRWLFCL